MGRESRGVLLLVALAVLAATDAFSTDSKSFLHFCQKEKTRGTLRASETGEREGVSSGEELVFEA